MRFAQSQPGGRPLVVGVGHCTLDCIALVERHPQVDTKTQLEEVVFEGGGPVATALVTLSRLGISTRIASRVADDDFGCRIAAGLREERVDITALLVQPGRRSPFSFVEVERGTGRRTIYWTRGDTDPLAESDLPAGLLDGADALLVDGHQFDAQLPLAAAAHRAGIPVLLDAGSQRPGMSELVDAAQIVIASERFAAEIGGARAAVDHLAGRGPDTVVVTLGERGAIGRRGGGEMVEEPALSGEVVDTTGAGDVYHGAFLYGVLQGWLLERTMRFASIAAGLKCRALGGRTAIPSLSEILALASP